jgi:hypothetical protein
MPKKNRYQFRQTQPHSANCRTNPRHMWAVLMPVEVEYHNCIGVGRGYSRWIHIRCNDPRCAGRAIVAESNLFNGAEYGKKESK